MKICCHCKRELPESEFHQDKLRHDGLHPDCKGCRRTADQGRYGCHKVSINEKNRKRWRDRNYSDKYGYDYWKRIKQQYGLSKEDWFVMYNATNGKCPICQREVKLVLDHNHETNQIRGLLCRNCNGILGMMNDDVGSFERAAEYLKKTKEILYG